VTANEAGAGGVSTGAGLSASTGTGASTSSTNVTSAAPTAAIEWSEGDVAAWLDRIGTAYSKYKAAFIENSINGEMLLADDFSEEYLDELGVSSKMHRSRIMKERIKLHR
jgi:hypothetical protein